MKSVAEFEFAFESAEQRMSKQALIIRSSNELSEVVPVSGAPDRAPPPTQKQHVISYHVITG